MWTPVGERAPDRLSGTRCDRFHRGSCRRPRLVSHALARQRGRCEGYKPDRFPL